MTKQETREWILRLLRENKLYQFYKNKVWLSLREEVLKENHYECDMCKKEGKITRAVTVHHVQYVKKHPELALSRTYSYQGKTYINLIPLCHDCHDRVHGRMMYKKKEKPLTKERW
ncbi:MAG: HNH endonuclease [Anaerostipes sp.]|jgi:5-methylcytosine-specific restriction protein A|nr:HNH endonuclease [Anaerostipes sp.]